VERTFHYANDYTVALPPAMLPAPATRTQLELESALVELRARQEDALWKWSDVAAHLPDPERTESARAFFMRKIGSDLTIGWPTYARVRRNAYRFLAEGEAVPKPSTCEGEVLDAVREVLLPAQRTPFSWRDVWFVMVDRGTVYGEQAIRTTVTQHMVDPNRPQQRGEPPLRRVGRGMYVLAAASPAEPSPVRKSAPTMVRLECAWCGRIFKREARQVHPGPTYCSRSHLAQANWATSRSHETQERVQAHGTYSEYRKGCRCDPCKAANTERIRRYRASLKP